jgi:hypothetical protein
MLVKSKLHDAPYVHGCMDRWARWCIGVSCGQVSPTGRIMIGMRGNICPLWIEDVQNQKPHSPYCPRCHGKGRLKISLDSVVKSRPETCPICKNIRAKGKSYTEFAGKECFRCHGEGLIVIENLHVNPAAIRSTRHDGGKFVSDATSELIEATWCQWGEFDETHWHNKIVFREYFWVGTQEMKAAGDRKYPDRHPPVSPSFYSRTLKDALRRVEIVLEGV